MNTSNLMEDFYTRSKANEGIDMPLYLPTGELSPHSMKIRGYDSDVFRDMDNQCKREMATSAELSAKEITELYRKLKLKLIACLVISWTFKKECTLDNVMEFLINAPQIADSIDRVAGKRSLFFGKGLTSSSSQPVKNSASSKNRKGQNKVSKKASNKSTKPRA